MKIAYVFDSLTRTGGTERILTSKMNYLADVMGYDVYLVTWCQFNQPYPFPLSSKIHHTDIAVNLENKSRGILHRIIFQIKTRNELRKRLQQTIGSITPDIIIATAYQQPGLICSLSTGAKKILESHCPKSLILGVNNSIFVKGWNLSIIYHRYSVLHSLHVAEKKCDCLVCLTNGDAEEWKTKAKIVIPNSIALKNGNLSTCTAKRVICAGRLNEQKGFDMMIDAWIFVANKHKDWGLAIFGEGELKDSLIKQSDNNNLSGCVHIYPFSNNIYSEYAKSSIYVLSSRYEGFGLVLAEAMSCGIPCISFDCHYGPSDIIRDGVDGLLVANGDTKALADAICWMIEHDAERISMGKKAKANIERYGREVVMKQWDDLFRQLCQK